MKFIYIINKTRAICSLLKIKTAGDKTVLDTFKYYDDSPKMPRAFVFLNITKPMSYDLLMEDHVLAIEASIFSVARTVTIN